MKTFIVRALKPIKAGTKGFYDMLGVPLTEDCPAGRRVRMECDQSVKAASSGHVEMLSPDGIKALSGAQYKTRVQTAETAPAPAKRTRAATAAAE